MEEKHKGESCAFVGCQRGQVCKRKYINLAKGIYS